MENHTVDRCAWLELKIEVQLVWRDRVLAAPLAIDGSWDGKSAPAGKSAARER